MNKKALLVDKNPVNTDLLGQALEKNHFSCTAANTYARLDEELENLQEYDIVLMDVAGFDPAIWDRCKKIHFGKTPFLILSVNPGPALQKYSISSGASGVVKKPVILNELLAIVNSMIDDG